MSIYVVNPGAFTTVQDLGRYGFQSSGIPQSGAMDQASFLAGNQILENDPNAAALEMTLYGGIYRFESETVITLTGADMQPALNGEPVRMDTPVRVRAGDVLTLGTAVYGCRTYLSARGGIQVPEVLGSRSTTVRCALGGLEGRALKAGDRIPVLFDVSTAHAPAANPSEDSSSYSRLSEIRSGTVSVRAVPGPQDDYFTEKGIETFFSTQYTVSVDSDRMGCRLSGEPVESKNGTDIISDGTAFGSVQVPSSGQPIVLMADRQTSGGYAKIATVISADLPLLAQVRPGDRVRFQKISVEE